MNYCHGARDKHGVQCRDTPGHSERVLRACAAPDSVRCGRFVGHSAANPGRRYGRKRPTLCPGVTAANRGQFLMRRSLLVTCVTGHLTADFADERGWEM